MRRRTLVYVVLIAATIPITLRAQDTSVVGLWYSKRWFGPELRGSLFLERVGSQWRASIGSRTVGARVVKDSVSLDLSPSAVFKGGIGRSGVAVTGYWIEPERRMAMPLSLSSCGRNCYVGRVRNRAIASLI